jgi:hypothetical protein
MLGQPHVFDEGAHPAAHPPSEQHEAQTRHLLEQVPTRLHDSRKPEFRITIAATHCNNERLKPEGEQLV